MNTFYGIKLGQTQTFTANGERIPVTEIYVEPATVVQVKTEDNDGYVSLKVAFGNRKAKNISKSVKGELSKIQKSDDSKTEFPRYFREIRVKSNEDIKDIKAGDQIKITDIFKEGDFLNVSGVTIGRGFQGGVKRWGFHGGPRTHGQSDRERAPGSIGQTTTPGRVYKGKHMAGKMGGYQATVKNLSVAKIDSEKNVVLIKGLVPGKKKGVVILYK